jgi:hypothetical protein
VWDRIANDDYRLTLLFWYLQDHAQPFARFARSEHPLVIERDSLFGIQQLQVRPVSHLWLQTLYQLGHVAPDVNLCFDLLPRMEENLTSHAMVFEVIEIISLMVAVVPSPESPMHAFCLDFAARLSGYLRSQEAVPVELLARLWGTVLKIEDPEKVFLCDGFLPRLCEIFGEFFEACQLLFEQLEDADAWGFLFLGCSDMCQCFDDEHPLRDFVVRCVDLMVEVLDRGVPVSTDNCLFAVIFEATPRQLLEYFTGRMSEGVVVAVAEISRATSLLSNVPLLEALLPQLTEALPDAQGETLRRLIFAICRLALGAETGEPFISAVGEVVRLRAAEFVAGKRFPEAIGLLSAVANVAQGHMPGFQAFCLELADFFCRTCGDVWGCPDPEVQYQLLLLVHSLLGQGLASDDARRFVADWVNGMIFQVGEIRFIVCLPFITDFLPLENVDRFFAEIDMRHAAVVERMQEVISIMAKDSPNRTWEFIPLVWLLRMLESESTETSSFVLDLLARFFETWPAPERFELFQRCLPNPFVHHVAAVLKAVATHADDEYPNYLAAARELNGPFGPFDQ